MTSKAVQTGDTYAGIVFLTPARTALLRTLVAGNHRTATQLSSTLGKRESSVSAMLERLLRAGLVEIRGLGWCATHKGRAAVAAEHRPAANTRPRPTVHAPTEDLGRAYLLDVTADGAVLIREPGAPCDLSRGMPVFSCDTLPRCGALIAAHCAGSFATHVVWRLHENLFPRGPDGTGDVDSLDGVTVAFRATYARLLATEALLERVATHVPMLRGGSITVDGNHVLVSSGSNGATVDRLRLAIAPLLADAYALGASDENMACLGVVSELYRETREAHQKYVGDTDDLEALEDARARINKRCL